MTITGYLKPRPDRRPAPMPIYDQDALRERRRRHLAVTLNADFDLAAEVAAICEPIAVRIAAQPAPAAFIGHVETIADTVGGLCGTVAELLAQARISRLDTADRRRAREAVRTLSRSSVPAITADMLTHRSWVTALVEMASHNSSPLAGLLARQAADRRDAPTVSEVVIDALRGLDLAALDTTRRIDKAEFWRTQFGERTAPATHTPETARNTLRELGIENDR